MEIKLNVSMPDFSATAKHVVLTDLMKTRNYVQQVIKCELIIIAEFVSCIGIFYHHSVEQKTRYLTSRIILLNAIFLYIICICIWLEIAVTTDFSPIYEYQEELEDTNDVIRNRKSKEDRQHNGEKK